MQELGTDASVLSGSMRGCILQNKSIPMQIHLLQAKQIEYEYEIVLRVQNESNPIESIILMLNFCRLSSHGERLGPSIMSCCTVGSAGHITPCTRTFT